MKRNLVFGLAVLAAQSVSAADAPKPAATVSSIVENEISTVEKLVVEAAEAMPEEKFNFTPESANLAGSDYKGVRTFALEVRHVGTANYFLTAAVAGEKPPANIKGPNGPEELKTKAEIVKYLKDSFAVAHKAAATLTEQNMLQVPADGKRPRLEATTFAVAHAYDHYGQMVEYLRMNGIVPPASQKQAQGGSD
jgi:uncharacterized damage-inducible protein DinB